MNQLAEKQDNQPITVMDMLNNAVQSGSDPDTLTKLVDLQERIHDKNAEQAYAQAMVAAQKSMPTIKNESKNDQTRSMYSKLDKINTIIVPIYTQYGFALSFGTDTSPLEGHVRITCDVMHEQGHTKKYFYDLPIDDSGIKGSVNKTKVHASSSSMSYGRRYLTVLIFNLTVGDDVDGNVPGQTITEEQHVDLSVLMKEVKADEAKFFAHFNINKLHELPMTKYNAAMNALNAKKKTK